MSPSESSADGDRQPSARREDLRSMARLSIFGALGQDSIAFLVARCAEVEVPRGAAFFQQGESGDSVFVLRRGRIAIERSHGERRLVLAELEPGALFGEMALVGICARTATARALEDAAALRLPHRAILELSERDLRDFALLQMNLAREVARRLAAADQRLLELE